LDKKNLVCDFISEFNAEEFVWRYYTNTFQEGWAMPDFHNHRAVELIHVLEGHGFMKFKSDVEKITKNNCLLIMPASEHQFYVENNESCTLINIHFIIEGTPLEKLNIGDSSSILPDVTVPNDEYLKFSNSTKLGEIMKKIVDELDNKNQDYKLYLSLCFSELFIELSRICTNLFQICPPASETLLNEVVDYIDMNLAEDISPSTIADALHFNSSYLMHTFKETMKMPVMEYVRLKRIEKSKRILVDTNYNITQVAHKVGIANSQHFSTLFKKYTFMSPKEYRKISLIRNNTNTNIYK